MHAVGASVRLVFSNVAYLSAALGTAALVFTIAVWLPNLALIVQVVTSDTAGLLDKFNFLFSLYGSITTNFTVVSASYTILIVVLFGVSVAMFVFYIHQQQGSVRGSTSAASLGGLVSGFFGIGCAACGTFILTSLVGLFGAGGVLTFLPLGGEEFGFIGVGLLGYSIYKTSEMIQKPKTCAVESSHNTTELIT